MRITEHRFQRPRARSGTSDVKTPSEPDPGVLRTIIRQITFPAGVEFSDHFQTLIDRDLFELSDARSLVRFVLEELGAQTEAALNKRLPLGEASYRTSQRDAVDFKTSEGETIFTVQNPTAVLDQLRREDETEARDARSKADSVTLALKLENAQGRSAMPALLGQETEFLVKSLVPQRNENDPEAFESNFLAFLTQLALIRRGDQNAFFLLGLDDSDPRKAIAERIIYPEHRKFIEIGGPAVSGRLLVQFMQAGAAESLYDPERTLPIPVLNTKWENILAVNVPIYAGKGLAVLVHKAGAFKAGVIDRKILRSTIDRGDLLGLVYGYWKPHAHNLLDPLTLVALIAEGPGSSAFEAAAIRIPQIGAYPIGARLAAARLAYQAVVGSA